MKFVRIVFTTALLIIAGCDGSGPVEEPNEMGLHHVLSAKIKGLDPGNMRDVYSVIVASQIFEPLYDIAPPPFGDGIVDVQDLIVLSEHLFGEPGLITCWKLDETEGGVAYDSASGNDGTVHGDPAWHPEGGIVDGALQLDGTDDCVSTSLVLKPADGKFNALIWIKSGAPDQVVLSQCRGTNWLCADSLDTQADLEDFYNGLCIGTGKAMKPGSY